MKLYTVVVYNQSPDVHAER